MSKGQRKGKRQPKPRPRQVAPPPPPPKTPHPVRTALKVISTLIVLGLILYLIIGWNSIPDQVPTAFDEAGVPVEYAGKGSLIFMPVVGILLALMMAALVNDTRVWRFPFALRDEMRAKANGIMNNAILLLALEVELLFLVMCLSMALSWQPPSFLLPGLMGAVIVTVVGGNLLSYAVGGKKKDGSGSGPSRPSGGSSPLTEPPANSLARRY